MAREQVLQEPVDRRTDVYAAGVVLYSLLTGSLPYVGSAAALLYQIAHTKADPPRSLDPSISPELDALVMRALSPSADDRFATAHEMAAELERIAPPATQLAVGAWVQEIAESTLAVRAQQLLEVERAPNGGARTPSVRPQNIESVRPPAAFDGASSAAVAMTSSGSREASYASRLRLMAIGFGGVILIAALIAIATMTEAAGEDTGTSPPTTASADKPAVVPEVVAVPPATGGASATVSSLPAEPSTRRPPLPAGRPSAPPGKKTGPGVRPNYGF